LIAQLIAARIEKMFTFDPYKYDFINSQFAVAGESMIFHCHHYNTFLLRSIMDAEYLDSRPFLIGASAEVAYLQLKDLFKQIPDSGQRIKIAQELYRLSGFGVIDLATLNATGGEVKTKSSHYTFAWKEKFGKSTVPVGFFHQGYIAGAHAAIFNLSLDKVTCEQESCVSMGADEDVFVVKQGKANFRTFTSKQGFKFNTIPEVAEVQTNVARAAITEAVAGMPLLGNASGHIPAFGVYLTRMYADYYNRISFEFENDLIKLIDHQGFDVARGLLLEAGHACAFNTFGGIMTSPEWDALIKPQLKTKEDWVSGVVSCINSLGWGVWKTMDVSSKGGRFRIYNGYESLGYQRMYGKAEHPIDYLATGGAAGLFNLVYLGDIAAKPKLTNDFYQHLFKGKGVFVARQEKCQAMGHEYSEIVVTKS
jgi:hypothetical protein